MPARTRLAERRRSARCARQRSSAVGATSLPTTSRPAAARATAWRPTPQPRSQARRARLSRASATMCGSGSTQLAATSSRRQSGSQPSIERPGYPQRAVDVTERCLALAEAAGAELYGPNRAAWLARLTEARDDFAAALAGLAERGDAARGLRLAVDLRELWLSG